jgi:hypothetical protein
VELCERCQDASFRGQSHPGRSASLGCSVGVDEAQDPNRSKQGGCSRSAYSRLTCFRDRRFIFHRHTEAEDSPPRSSYQGSGASHAAVRPWQPIAGLRRGVVEDSHLERLHIFAILPRGDPCVSHPPGPQSLHPT